MPKIYQGRKVEARGGWESQHIAMKSESSEGKREERKAGWKESQTFKLLQRSTGEPLSERCPPGESGMGLHGIPVALSHWLGAACGEWAPREWGDGVGGQQLVPSVCHAPGCRGSGRGMLMATTRPPTGTAPGLRWTL